MAGVEELYKCFGILADAGDKISEVLNAVLFNVYYTSFDSLCRTAYIFVGLECWLDVFILLTVLQCHIFLIFWYMPKCQLISICRATIIIEI